LNIGGEVILQVSRICEPYRAYLNCPLFQDKTPKDWQWTTPDTILEPIQRGREHLKNRASVEVALTTPIKAEKN